MPDCVVCCCQLGGSVMPTVRGGIGPGRVGSMLLSSSIVMPYAAYMHAPLMVLNFLYRLNVCLISLYWSQCVYMDMCPLCVHAPWYLISLGFMAYACVACSVMSVVSGRLDLMAMMRVMRRVW